MSHKQLTFSATVIKVKSNVSGVFNPCVKVPEDIVSILQQEAKKEKGPLPVRGNLVGKPFKATVIRYTDKWLLYLNTEMRKSSGVDVNDIVKISLEYDPEPRILPVPRQLKDALNQNKKVKKIWGKLSLSQRREYLSYLNSLKSEEALVRNVKKVMFNLKLK